jgi:hypothetical protein
MRALVLGAGLCFVLACSRTQPRETSSPSLDTAASLLGLYDLAGFPTITGRKLVERRTELDRGRPLCERGVLFEHRGKPVFLTVDLQLRHGIEAFESIPAALRRSIAREQLFGRQVIAHGPARIERVIDSELPVTVLARPRMGVDDPREPPCRTTEPGHHLDPSARRVDVFVRAQWAQMRGLPQLARELQDVLGADDPEQMRRLRSDLASALVEEAERAMLGWQPRDEVEHLLRRAAAIAPEPRRSRILADAQYVSVTTPAIDTEELLVEQAMHPGWSPLLPVGIEPLLTWNPREHLRDPIAELLQLGMPGVRRLVRRLGDPTWTRTSCNGVPCRVGDLVREGLGRFAMREFATNDEARAWWSSVEHMTDREFLRAAMRGPEFFDAARRLVRLVGPDAIEDLVALRGAKPADDVIATIAAAVSIHEIEVIADPQLRRRYSEVLRELHRAAEPGWSPGAIAALLTIDPPAALDILVARLARDLPHLREQDVDPRDSDFDWGTAFEVALASEHRAMIGLILRVLVLPTRHPLSNPAWEVVATACAIESADTDPDEDLEIPCPRSVRRTATRVLRRRLASPSRR